MTEFEWQSHRFPPAMVEYLRGRASDRQLRLFACACARWTWDGDPGRPYRAAVEAAERFADGRGSAADLADAHRAAQQAATEWANRHLGDSRQFPLIAPADAAARSAFEAAHVGALDAGWTEAAGEWQMATPAYAALADLARDVFGNPFRPPAFDPRWRTADALGLARGIYEDRAFDRLPLLADALMDAGCDDDPLLGHCRGAGPHVRGCWVVDLVLGRG